MFRKTNLLKIIFGVLAFFQLLPLVIAQNLFIQGKILNAPLHLPVRLENLSPPGVIGQTEVTEHNEFLLKTHIENENIYRLSLGKDKYIHLIIAPGDSITIEADLNNLGFPVVTGNRHSEKFFEVLQEIRKKDIAFETMRQDYIREKKEFIRTFLQNNPTSLSTLFFMEQVSISENVDLYEKVISGLKMNYPDNVFVLDLEKRLYQEKHLCIGCPAPDIELPDTSNNLLALSSLKGKVILIDFWASWCGPCRKEIPHLKELYQKYNPKGFEIFSVSLDRLREAWVNTIDKEDMNWLHVSDLKYWNSTVTKTYQFTSIPYMVLIDQEGKIIEKNIRGKTLDDKLQEIFNE